MHVAFDESNNICLRNVEEEQTSSNKHPNSNKQTQIENQNSIEEQRGCSFEIEEGENELHALNSQNVVTPTKEIRNVPREWRHQPNYPNEYIIGDSSQGVKIRSLSKKTTNLTLLSQIEPKNVQDVLMDKSWVEALKELA